MNSGIYKIANKITGDFYIGSSINIKNRFNCHKSRLNLNCHHSPFLQNVYNKYGLQNLNFEVVELVHDKKDLIKKEQFYIDTLHPRYNICKIAGSQLGIKHSEETRKKVSKSLLGNTRTLGYKNSEETKIKHSKPFKVMSPTGKLIKGVNFRQFCIDNNLDESHMYKVFTGKLNHHKGWTKVINGGEI